MNAHHSQESDDGCDRAWTCSLLRSRTVVWDRKLSEFSSCRVGKHEHVHFGHRFNCLPKNRVGMRCRRGFHVGCIVRSTTREQGLWRWTPMSRVTFRTCAALTLYGARSDLGVTEVSNCLALGLKDELNCRSRFDCSP